MKKLGLGIFCFLVSLVAANVKADVYFTGDTTGGPTFNRPVSLSSLSGSGTAVAYQVIPFWVNASGSYAVDVDSQSSLGFTHTDQYILVYSGAFNPATPLANLINGDDDHAASTGAYGPLATFGVVAPTGGLDGSRIAASGAGGNYAAGGLSLTAFSQYYLVVTGFGNTNVGTFQGAIGGGPGDAFLGAIPEPGSLALIGLGSMLGLFVRRRK
jgi:hypothetical protein